MKKILLLLGVSLIPFHSCTTSQQMSDNQKSIGHFRLYTYPDKLKSDKYDKGRYKKVVIVSSNDMNGRINPHIHPIPNRANEERLLKIGGIAVTKAYLDSLREKYDRQLLYVDAGSFLNQKNNHAQTLFYYKYLGVDVASLGLNELSLDTPPGTSLLTYLDQLTSKADIDIVNSNLFDLVKATQVELKGTSAYTIKEVNGLKVGFIGVLTSSISEKVPDKKINGLYIQNPTKNIITKATNLRRKGAHIVVVLASEGIDCTSRMAHAMDLPEEKVNFNPLESGQCDTYKSEFNKILEGLPAQTIDLAITSGKSSKVANFIKGIPVLQNFGNGKFLSWAELYYDKKYKTIVTSMTAIRQPIMLCHNFLKEHQDCYLAKKDENLELIPAEFLGKKIKIKEAPVALKRLK